MSNMYADSGRSISREKDDTHEKMDYSTNAPGLPENKAIQTVDV